MKKLLSYLIALLVLISSASTSTNAIEEETVDWSTPYDEWISEHSKFNEKQPKVSEEIKSKDGKYGYVLNEETGEAYFSHSFEKNIKVLNIPEKIDGHRIVGAIEGKSESPFLFEVNYSKYIKDIYAGGLDFSLVPSCKINLNEGLEVVHQAAYTGIEKDTTGFYAEDGADEYLDEIVFPTTLKEIKPKALDPNIKRIVFQSDPIVDLGSNSRHQSIFDVSKYNIDCELEIYYTGDALNATDKSFAQWYTHTEMHSLFYYPWKIYHKRGAKGFDKLEEYGCEVEEYTEEVWKKPTKSRNPATKIVIDDITIKVPMKKNIWVEPKLYPENADKPRIWYFPQHNSFFPDVYIKIDGLIHRSAHDDTRDAGTTTKIIAVADCGIVTEFTVTLTDKDITTTAAATTTKTTKTTTTEQKPSDKSEVLTDNKTTGTTETETKTKAVAKSENVEPPKRSITKIVIGISIFVVFVVAGAGIYFLRKKKHK